MCCQIAACNLACSHCFAGALPRQEKPLTLAELDVLFSSMAQMGSFRLGLTGGETGAGDSAHVTNKFSSYGASAGIALLF